MYSSNDLTDLTVSLCVRVITVRVCVCETVRPVFECSSFCMLRTPCDWIPGGFVNMHGPLHA